MSTALGHAFVLDAVWGFAVVARDSAAEYLHHSPLGDSSSLRFL